MERTCAVAGWPVARITEVRTGGGSVEGSPRHKGDDYPRDHEGDQDEQDQQRLGLGGA
jgi:hypothetical protein